MKMQANPEIVESTQWNTIRDYPGVKLLDVSKIKTTPVDKVCGKRWDEHGVIDTRDGFKVLCPGDYIIDYDDKTCITIKPDMLKIKFTEI
jgi:hypothetical protein